MSVTVENKYETILEQVSFQMGTTTGVYSYVYTFNQLTINDKPTHFDVWLSADNSTRKLKYNKVNDRYENDGIYVEKNENSDSYDTFVIRDNEDLSGGVSLTAFYKYVVMINGYHVRDAETYQLLTALTTRLASDENRIAQLEQDLDDLKLYVDEADQDLRDYIDEKIADIDRKITVPLTGVTITGTVGVGQTLTANIQPSDGTCVGYQWYRGSTAISGATGKTYTITSADGGYKLKVRAYQDDTVYVESAYTSQIGSWTRQSVDITLQDGVTYNFPNTVRNVQGTFRIRGNGNVGSGSDITLQLGVRTNPSVLAQDKFKSQWAEGRSTSLTYSDTFSTVNDRELTSINMFGWGSAFNNQVLNGTVNILETEFKITSYEVYE